VFLQSARGGRWWDGATVDGLPPVRTASLLCGTHIVEAEIPGVKQGNAREPESEARPESATPAGFITQYIAARSGMKPNTLQDYRQTERSLVGCFGFDRLLTEISAGDCDGGKAHQKVKGHAPATIGRNVKRARQFFRAAVRKRPACR
jgi:hypothetical protein